MRMDNPDRVFEDRQERGTANGATQGTKRRIAGRVLAQNTRARKGVRIAITEVCVDALTQAGLAIEEFENIFVNFLLRNTGSVV